jgi:hypothetical protein
LLFFILELTKIALCRLAPHVFSISFAKVSSNLCFAAVLRISPMPEVSVRTIATTVLLLMVTLGIGFTLILSRIEASFAAGQHRSDLALERMRIGLEAQERRIVSDGAPPVSQLIGDLRLQISDAQTCTSNILFSLLNLTASKHETLCPPPHVEFSAIADCARLHGCKHFGQTAGIRAAAKHLHEYRLAIRAVVSSM